MELDHERATPPAEQSLEILLASWATRHALSPSRAEAIRREVLRQAWEPEAVLPYEWWMGFFQDLQATLRCSVDLAHVLQAGSSGRLTLPATGL